MSVVSRSTPHSAMVDTSIDARVDARVDTAIDARVDAAVGAPGGVLVDAPVDALRGVPGGVPVDAAGDVPVNAARDGWPDATVDVSVVVPTYRRPAMLLRCLKAILGQTLDPSRFELLVCDDGPDEATREAVAALAAAHTQHGPAIRYLPVTATQGPAGARNVGWRHARAAIVAFTDDDTIPQPSWLMAGLAAMASGASAVTGAVTVPFEARRASDAPTDYEVNESGLSRAEFVTANCFVRRAMLEQLQGFDERYTSAWREDSDLQFRILKAGGTIERAERAAIVHPVRPARWGVSIGQQKKSQFDALLYKSHPDFYRNRIRSQPPWDYYVTVVAGAVGLGGLLSAAICAARGVPATSAISVSVASSALWVAMTVRFTAKRLARTSRAPAHIAEMLWTSIWIPPLSIFWRLYGACKFRVAFL